jgi:uncharacterized protein (TIGR02001 family)
MMKKTTFTFALAATLAAPLHAQVSQPEHTVSFNAALTSDYRYRGISQTRFEPALQAGADYTYNASGLYAGTWLSTIKWTKDAGGGGNAEWDLYAGRRGQVGGDLAWDAGMLAYIYPANGLGKVTGFADANTVEGYGQLGYGPVYAKYSLSLTNLFGFVDSRRSGYLDLVANIDLRRGLTLNVHAGRQQVRHNGQASYTDWKLGLSQDWGFATGALALVATNANEAAYASPANGKFVGKTALVASVSKTF